MCVSQSRFLYEGVKHFEVSVSQSKKSKCLGLAKKNAGLPVSQSLAFTIRHPLPFTLNFYNISLEMRNSNHFCTGTVSKSFSFEQTRV